MTDQNIILKHWGIESYADLMRLKPDEIVRLMDEKYTPVHEGDAFFAVMVLAALGEVRDTAKALDRAKRWFEFATVALAAASFIVAIVGVAVVAL